MTASRPVRFRCQLAAAVSWSGSQVTTRVLELSERGAFVEGVEPLPDAQSGDTLEVALPLPGGEPLAVQGVVQRHGSVVQELRRPGLDHVTVRRSGLGVEFVGLADDELERLRDFLELLEER